MSKILKITGLEKTYVSGDKQLTVLHDISFDVEKGQTFSMVRAIRKRKNHFIRALCWLRPTKCWKRRIVRTRFKPFK